jgi:hypothetical protein
MPLGSRVRNKFDLNWRPRTDLAKLIDAAWAYKRAPEHPQKGLVSWVTVSLICELQYTIHWFHHRIARVESER